MYLRTSVHASSIILLTFFWLGGCNITPPPPRTTKRTSKEHTQIRVKSIGNHWIALYVKGNNTTYFHSSAAEHIPKFIRNKNITNIYRIQAYDSIMCGYFCSGFIDFMLKGKSLLDYTRLFSPNEYQKNY